MISNMKVEDLRRLRTELGLTQLELAERAGCSQSVISMLEKGTYKPSDLLMSRIQKALQPLSCSPKSNQETFLSFPEVNIHSSMPIKVRLWKRPKLSGDFLFHRSLSPESYLIVACDIAGNGVEQFPYSVYLSGWLNGYLETSPSTLRLEGLVDALGSILKALGKEAALYAIMITRSRSEAHSVTYEALSCGFPPPLLLLGPPYKTLPTGQLFSSLPLLSDSPLSIIRQVISAPWRVVIASDGMLSRLGEGSEDQGRRKLFSMMKGAERNFTLDKLFQTNLESTDDEMLVVVEWVSWDRELSFDVGNVTSHNYITDVLAKEIASVIGPDKANRMIQALVEALNNVAIHAYYGESGMVVVRYRREPKALRIEVEDFGKGGVTRSQIMKPASGFAVMRAMVSRVETWSGPKGGTVISLVAEIKD
jgi:transcriptional regulator with XRE-family HTH domain